MSDHILEFNRSALEVREYHAHERDQRVGAWEWAVQKCEVDVNKSETMMMSRNKAVNNAKNKKVGG